jgi:hypothetical protein
LWSFPHVAEDGLSARFGQTPPKQGSDGAGFPAFSDLAGLRSFDASVDASDASYAR